MFDILTHNFSLHVVYTYCRFCDHWRFVSQRFAFLGAFILYLESERLITRQELAEMLGGQVFFLRIKCAKHKNKEALRRVLEVG